MAAKWAQRKPCAIHQGWGLQRTANGELACRAIAMLSLPHRFLSVCLAVQQVHVKADINIPFVRFPTVPNPVETSISMFMWTDAIHRHHEMTDITDGVRGAERLKNPIKMILNYAGNCIINQHSDINKTHAILQDESACEMIVVVDNHRRSPSAALPRADYHPCPT
ncbi:molybdopterin-dependent oxidoreductase [Vibrio chagasii]|nr:molybdopterin-dependent oxidoreductase [Vibrio chagasii]